MVFKQNLNKHDNAMIPMKGFAWYTKHVRTVENKKFITMQTRKQDQSCNLSDSVVNLYPRSML